MKNLNRKGYKKLIKDFRKTNPIAQVQHKWCKFNDEYGHECLMFVHGSIIERVKHPHDPWSCFKIGEYYVRINLHGYPLMKIDFDGIVISRYSPKSVKASQRTMRNFKILEENEVARKYDSLFEYARNLFRYRFETRTR